MITSFFVPSNVEASEIPYIVRYCEDEKESK